MDVSVVACNKYDEELALNSLRKCLDEIGGLDFVKSGMKIAIKANLVSFMKPEKAATTHPVLLSALTRLLTERGASVVIGDSPGGLYNAAFLNRVYSATGMHETEKHGATLNYDFSQKEATFEGAKKAKSFLYTAYLDNVDAVINFCKLKSHGMMGMSCAVKNMFGVVPGIIKPEYHYRYPAHADFADMIVDLNEYFRNKVKLCICDAVVGMEGNGPTAGDPREINCILASKSPYKLDLVAARLIGLNENNVPTLMAARLRGLAPESVSSVEVSENYEKFIIHDYKNINTHTSLEFKGNEDKKGIKRIFGSVVGKLLRSKPKVKGSLCIACRVCENICPPKAIVMKKGKAVIDRSKCIRCFCCQEFCPKGAMKVHRTVVSRILTK